MGVTVAIAAASGLVCSPAIAGTLVSTELVLSIDVSGSVNETEFYLQRDAYANAFRDADLINLISGLDNGIAVTWQYWSTITAAPGDWFHITDTVSANAFADAIAASTRPFAGATNLAAAINSAADLLLTNDFTGDRMVIDVSGDGRQNTNLEGTNYCAPFYYYGYIYNNDFSTNCYPLVESARDAAVAKGITVNGLPILTDVANLDSYFTSYAIGGDDAFVQAASSFLDFETALKTKITREIQVSETAGESVPEPSLVLGLLTVGLGGGSVMRSKMRSATAHRSR